jgi:hypothetical protein
VFRQLNYKQKYLILKKKFKLAELGEDIEGLGLDPIGKSMTRVSGLMAEAQCANILGINCFNEVRSSTMDYNEVGPLQFTEIDPLDADSYVQDTIRALASLAYNLMDRFAMVSEAYKEIVYKPTVSPERLLELSREASRAEHLSRKLGTRGDTAIERNIDITNVSGLSVKGKIVSFERMSPTGGSQEWAIKTPKTRETRKSIPQPIPVDDTAAREVLHALRERGSPQPKVKSRSGSKTREAVSKERRRLQAAPPGSSAHANRASQLVGRLFSPTRHEKERDRTAVNNAPGSTQAASGSSKPTHHRGGENDSNRQHGTHPLEKGRASHMGKQGDGG